MFTPGHRLPEVAELLADAVVGGRGARRRSPERPDAGDRLGEVVVEGAQGADHHRLGPQGRDGEGRRAVAGRGGPAVLAEARGDRADVRLDLGRHLDPARGVGEGGDREVDAVRA